MLPCQLIFILVSFQGLNLGNEHLPSKDAALSQCQSSGQKDDLQADRLVKITAWESVDQVSDSDSRLRLPSFSDSRLPTLSPQKPPDSRLPTPSSRQLFKISDSRLRLPNFSVSRLPTPYPQKSTDSRLRLSSPALKLAEQLFSPQWSLDTFSRHSAGIASIRLQTKQ